MSAVPAIYDVTIGHARTTPFLRSFSHHGHYWLIDLDRLPEIPAALRPFVKFESRDHFPAPAESIRKSVDTFLAENAISLVGGRVLMLSSPRSLGYVFNPLSIFWCYDSAGQLAAVIAEVHNTYGSRHAYLLRPDSAGVAQMAKEFYVSPFFEVRGDYTVSVPEPDERVAVSISLQQDDSTVFSAWVTGTANPVTTARILATVARHPLGSYRVSTLIRRHGIALWLRRLPVVKRPATAPLGARR